MTGNASVTAIADHNVLAEVITIAGGAGSVGASISQATLDANVSVDVTGSVTLEAGTIALEARNNHNGVLADGKKARALAVAPSAGLLGAGSGTFATAKALTDVSTHVGLNSKLTSKSGSISIRSFNSDNADSDGLGLSIGLGVAIGASVVNADASGNTTAIVEGEVTSNSSLTVKAMADNIATADAETCSAGIAAGAGAASGAGVAAVGTGVAHNTVKGTVLAGIETGTHEAGSIAISAIEKASIDAKAVGIAISGGISSAGGEAVNDIANNVKGRIFNDVVVTAHGNVSIDANDTSVISAKVDQTSGGLVGGGTAETINNIANHVEASASNHVQMTASGNVLINASEDILIGGRTIHDNILNNLFAIQHEWIRTDIDYTHRVNNLKLGVGPNQSVKLNAAAILDDAVTDQLFGNEDLDWFWARTSGPALTVDQLSDAINGEVVN